MMQSVKMSVRMTGTQRAWLDAVAEVRGESHSDVVRRAISWFCVRETERVERTRHYALIAYVSRQEAWNPVDEHLREVYDEELDGVGASMQSAYRRAVGPAEAVPPGMTAELVYYGPERRLAPR
jgi:metal-responsive CopG/Arc/MetJ family transcriptional regulator